MTDADRVLSLLRNASATQPDIAFALGITIRKVQEAIQELRLAGYPIVTSGNGVRLSPWAIDVEMCADALRRRLAHQYLTLRAMRATARRMRDQEAAAQRLTLWGEVGVVFA